MEFCQRIRERRAGAAHASYSVDFSGACRLEHTPACGIEASLRARLFSFFSEIFLPDGYPESVRPEYITYQFYDTVQALCSYLRGILTTTAILEASGVGKEAASPLAAAVAWVMRDGFGMLGSLVFAFCVGSRFDSSVKEWRLFADLINDVGLSLDMLAPMLPDRFVLITSCGAMCKTMCGVAAGATRASITAHFALRDNLADVSTKEGAQETAVSLLGLVVGVGLAQHTTLSHASARLLFGLLTALHIFANYRGVRSLCLCSLNAQRARLLIDAVADGGSADRVSIAQREAIFRWHSGPRIRLGTSVAAAFGGTLGGTAFAAAAEACAGERHVLWPSGRCVHVLLEDGCSQLDQLRAFTHARLLLRARGERGFSRWPDDQSGGEVCALSAEVASTRAELKGFFSRLLAAVDEHGWSVLCVHLDAGPYRYSREM